MKLNETLIKTISEQKQETKFFLDYRLKALKCFNKMPMPHFGPKLNDVNFDDVTYYLNPSEMKRAANQWEDVPDNIKNTYDKLGIIKAEQERLVAGVAAQYESEVIYHKIQDNLKQQGVVFLDMETGAKQHPELIKKYFGKLVPMNDNKFAALNSAVFSGGSFIYVPKNVEVKIPLQAYFRINSERMGQFERTLIIVDEGASVHYVEGCTAPIYTTNSLHAAVVEIFVEKNAKCKYSTIQNWSTNVYNLVTKRAQVEQNGTMEWVDGNIGSKVSMKYPACILNGPGATGKVLSLSVADDVQKQDTGANMIHKASDTRSIIKAKSISKNGGAATYRGWVKVQPGVKRTFSQVDCDSLLLDNKSSAISVPTIAANEKDLKLSHEASIGSLDAQKLFYLQSKGLSKQEAKEMLVRGFIAPISENLPMEYAVELNRLVQLEI